jgi:membrane-associated phospholipid phosphatase
MTTEITSKFFTRAAITLSIIFHPLLIPVYGILLVFSAPTLYGYLPFTVKRVLLLIILVNNVILPLLFLLLLRFRNQLSSWMIEERRERIMPLVITSLFYSVTVFIFLRIPIPLFLKFFVMAAALVSLAITFISARWKISIHSSGAGALSALVVILSARMHTSLTWFLIPVIIISGLVMSARLLLKVHRPAEVWIGFLTGFLIPVILLLAG